MDYEKFLKIITERIEDAEKEAHEAHEASSKNGKNRLISARYDGILRGLIIARNHLYCHFRPDKGNGRVSKKDLAESLNVQVLKSHAIWLHYRFSEDKDKRNKAPEALRSLTILAEAEDLILKQTDEG